MHPIKLSKTITHALHKNVRGEVRLDPLSCQIYSTDASNYRIVPLGVVIPWDSEDVSNAIKIANEHNVSLIPRGGGSSLSGQSIGLGLVLDYSRHINQILEINRAEQWVRVESGVVLATLNRILRRDNLMVGPDPSSAPVATMGGMVGNNSTGTHSIKYGMMVDQVQEIEVVLADGSLATFGPKSSAQVRQLAQQSTLEGKLYREIPQLIEEYSRDIRHYYPGTWRNVAGYNLNYLLDDQRKYKPLNLAPLIVGSEGTLAQIINIKLKVVPKPPKTRLAMIHFDELRPCLEAVPFILEHDPSAVELIDRFNIRLTRDHVEYRARQATFIEGDPRAVLMVEFAGDNPVKLAAQTKAMTKQLRQQGCQGTIIHCETPTHIENVWATRKAGFGLMMSQRGDTKALAFVDDATVPIEYLPDYAELVEDALAHEGVSASFLGHVSAGCMHVNPAINLKTETGLHQMEALSQAITEAAIYFNGTSTGEHGEGLARSYYNEQVFGKNLHQAFKQLKSVFDPTNRLNPGKIVDGPIPWQPDILRINPSYKTPLAPNVTFYDFTDDGGFAGLVEMCNGQGICRNREAGVMCPSFRATRDETHSTRGRANALRAAMMGELGPHGMTSRELHSALDYCLECKACKRECSTLVDMAKLKSEFLAHYQAEHGVSLRTKLFANVATLNHYACYAPKLFNWTVQNPLIRLVLDSFLGINLWRGLPLLASTTFQQWFNQHPAKKKAPNGKVILWDDTFMSYNQPEVGRAAVRVLEAAGFEVVIMAKRHCCGRPMISKGLLKEAKTQAAHNVALLYPQVRLGIPIVGLEPSCLATLRDEYPDLLRTDKARLVAQHSFFIEEFISHLADEGTLSLQFHAPSTPQHILVHGHCHQRALTGTESLLTMLRLLPNTTVEEIDSGCCGMAGSFGYEKEHYQVSMACGEDRLFPAVRAANPATRLVATGFSCRHQISDGTQRQALHPIMLLADSLAN